MVDLPCVFGIFGVPGNGQKMDTTSMGIAKYVCTYVHTVLMPTLADWVTYVHGKPTVSHLVVLWPPAPRIALPEEFRDDT